jgi:DNA-binding MarR family transcriptional regulator
MPSQRDEVDDIRQQLADLYPDLDTRAIEVTVRVLRLAQAFDSRRAEHLATFDLTGAEFDLLATIRRTQGSVGVNPSRLLRSVMVTSGGLTKRLDRLEESGLIERHPDPGDRRGTLVRLTPAGKKQIDAVLPSVLAMEHEFLTQQLTTSELEEVATLLRRLGIAASGPEDPTENS